MFGPLNANASEDGAVLSWEYFGPPRTVFVEYTVEHSEEEWKKEAVNSSTHSFTIKDLKPGASYRVRVVARDPAVDSIVHSTEEVLVSVPAVANRQRNKGGKYPVKEKEEAHQDPEVQPMKEDDGTFGEYR
ncbi:hypothetical protein NHX12_020341 [Muraenolepis orangiensis]|uniref:Fibronectin type-III domain-containing protein n=1 Tax=Muraenolepis orangiensis TaxID=630683 RepID=A0A9Q0ERK5_9TELE|nr:hypothetical protein NHX12_020341 [Muraenolepis orangiensis]